MATSAVRSGVNTLSGDVDGDRLGALRVVAHDGEVVAAREHAGADAPRHVPGSDDRDVHEALHSGRGGGHPSRCRSERKRVCGELALRGAASRPCMPWSDAPGAYAGAASRSGLGRASWRAMRELIPSLVKTFFRCHSTV